MAAETIETLPASDSATTIELSESSLKVTNGGKPEDMPSSVNGVQASDGIVNNARESSLAESSSVEFSEASVVTQVEDIFKIASVVPILEEQVAALAAKLDKLVPKDKEDKLIAYIKKLPMEKWTPNMNFKSDEVTSNVLVVYYKKLQKIIDGSDQPADASHSSISGQTVQDSITMTPQRVQINSQVLLDEMESLSGLSFKKPCVMIPPFKVLVAMNDEFSQQLETLETAYKKKWGHGSGDKNISREDAEDATEENNGPGNKTKTILEKNADRERSEANGKEGDEIKAGEESKGKVIQESKNEPKEESKEESQRNREKVLIDHLRCLVEFIATDFDDVLRLRESIEKGTIPHGRKTIHTDELTEYHVYQEEGHLWSTLYVKDHGKTKRRKIPLELETTRRIWETSLDRIERQNKERNVAISFDRSKIMEFAVKHFKENQKTKSIWNGPDLRRA
ncbi:hypothetical protein B0A49_00873 [Cryomyces minteri]|uniref:Uncharacterized protein n=1 Tax=Cryomyces minteri TaxID=331657 RepID=A0A4U0XUL0_9PEZI|nr:hypothetical protein B0A49_00873 [Cryomyces minteri]